MQGDRISQTVLLGRPLPNTQIYLLDSHLQPVPVGVAGELYIAGAGLARGYLNQPQLTAEKFICKSLTQEPETRLYKTGDLARYLPDGNIEFIGRVDRQVKLRGFRIELGEIEAGLSHHPSVREATVLLQENEPGNQGLVAYIVSHSKLSVQDSQLIESLRSFLTDTFVGPRTPGKEILAGIWSQLLNLKKVGIHDNFFDLGRHSLLIAQLLAKVRESFQVELPLRVLFEAPSVASLAEKIEMQQGSPLEFRY